jgi:hypothetical protein
MGIENRLFIRSISLASLRKSLFPRFSLRAHKYCPKSQPQPNARAEKPKEKKRFTKKIEDVRVCRQRSEHDSRSRWLAAVVTDGHALRQRVRRFLHVTSPPTQQPPREDNPRRTSRDSRARPWSADHVRGGSVSRIEQTFRRRIPYGGLRCRHVARLDTVLGN